jgi:hypothetical protein
MDTLGETWHAALFCDNDLSQLTRKNQLTECGESGNWLSMSALVRLWYGAPAPVVYHRARFRYMSPTRERGSSLARRARVLPIHAR